METKTQNQTIYYSKMTLGRPRKYDGAEEALNANRINNRDNYYKKELTFSSVKKSAILK